MITPSQLRTLQTLFGLYARHILSASADLRAERLAWASQNVAREVVSFKELTADEAGRLIELLKISVGQPIKPARRPRSREAAKAAGRHGRKGIPISVEIMASADDVAAVHALRRAVGMSEEAFANWLAASRSSPTRGRRTLSTLADCNRTRWALKAMVRRRAG